MTLRARLNPRQGQVLHYCWISGIGTIFVSRTPVGPDDTPWPAPACGAHATHHYAVLAALDDRQGIETHPEQWNPKQGVSQGGGMTVRLRCTDAVLDLFAAEKDGINRTVLTETVGYDVAGTGEHRVELPVRSTADFDNDGYLYLGPETVWYEDKTAAQFGDAEPVLRGMWSWYGDGRLSRRHVAGYQLDRFPQAVTDHPTVWKGRRISLFQALVDEQGRCLDAAFKGDHQVEIWSGWIDGIAYDGDGNYTQIVLTCKSLAQQVLDREIGRDAVKAYIGGAMSAPSLDLDLFPAVITELYVTWNGNGPKDIGPVLITGDGQADGEQLRGLRLPSDVVGLAAARIAKAVSDWISDEWSGTDGLTYNWGYEPEEVDEEGRPLVGWHIDLRLTGGSVNPIRLYSGDLGPALSQLGFPSLADREVASSSDDVVFAGDHVLAEVILSPRLAYLSCFEDPDGGALFPDGPGFAVIEVDDVRETIRYAAKETLDPDDFTFQLTGVQRNVFGEQPPLLLRYLPGAGRTENPTITALYGWADTELPDVLLQMLLSTGSGAYGAYDLAPEAVGLAIDPAAVDAQSVETLADGPLMARSLTPDKPLKVKDFVSKAGVFHGFVFGGSIRERRFRLSTLTVPLPTDVAGGLVLTDQPGGGILRSLPRLRTVWDVTNAIEVKPTDVPGVDSDKVKPARVRYANGRDAQPDGDTLKADVPGMLQADLPLAAEVFSERIFALWGEVHYVATVWCDRRALLTSVGDLVTLTVRGIPTPWGTRGLVGRTGVVIGTKRTWYRPGENEAVELDVLLGPAYAGLAPTFKVATYDAGPPAVLTLSENEFTLPGDPMPWDGYDQCYDWMHGPPVGAAWKVVIWNQATYWSAEEHLVTGVADGEWQLTTPLALTPSIGNCYVEFAPWTAVFQAAAQRKYVHLAAADGLLGGSDPAFLWSP